MAKVEHPKFTMCKGRPDTHKITVGETCKVPLEDQIFPEEKRALAYLKSVCSTCEHYCDEFLYSCLFARKLDITRTIELIERNWKWRCENGFQEIPKMSELDWEFAKCNLLVPGTRTKDGYGVVYWRVSKSDPSQLDIEKVIRFCAWFYISPGSPVGMDVARNGALLIQDLSGLGWKHFDYKFQKRMMEIYQDNFPARLHKSIQINSPMILKMMWGLFKPFVKKKIMERFTIGTKEDILSYVDKDQLWEEYGGNLAYDNDRYIEDVKEYHTWYAKTVLHEEVKEESQSDEEEAEAEVDKAKGKESEKKIGSKKRSGKGKKGKDKAAA